MTEPTWTDDERALTAVAEASFVRQTAEPLAGRTEPTFSWFGSAEERDAILGALAGWSRQSAAQARNAALENRLTQALARALGYCDAAQHQDAQYADERGDLGRILNEGRAASTALQSHDGGSPGPSPRTTNYKSEKRCCTVCDAKKVCHVCGDQTLMACSDCRINFAATVYVCTKPACRDEHERKCYGAKP